MTKDFFQSKTGTRRTINDVHFLLLHLRRRVRVIEYNSELVIYTRPKDRDIVMNALPEVVPMTVWTNWLKLPWWSCWFKKIQIIDKSWVILPPRHHNCRCVVDPLEDIDGEM